MDKFILNIIHRPELVPEYLEKTAARGRVEDVSRENVITESLDIFKLQQKTAHDYGFKTTIQMTYSSLLNEEAIELAKNDSRKFGDEIGLTFVGLTCRDFRERFKTKELAIWLFSMEDKKKIVDFMFERFKKAFGFYPLSIGAYYMDAELVSYIKKKYPDVLCAVATCWEEGPKAYRNANNSWYTFLDGGPFNPWIPSKFNIHCPATDKKDDIGIVAIPHLSRDLIAVFDGPGSFFGTHPQNILRGLIYKNDELPYLYNMIDQYKSLKKYNRGYSYNMVFVGPGWMSKTGRWEARYELLVKSYQDCMSYYSKLKKNSEIEDQTMSEFSRWFRANKSYTEPCCALWQDILYGSEKQVFWYVDPYIRTAIDMNQGGAIIDLRPYASKLVRPVGAGTKYLEDASYPFIIQSFYRAGYFTHYAGEGSIKSCKVSYFEEEIDLCACRTKAHFYDDGNKRILQLDPVEIEFNDLKVKVISTFVFNEGEGIILIKRKITEMSKPDADVLINEYFTGCYGTTEYPEDLTGMVLKCINKNNDTEKQINYQYKCREEEIQNACSIQAVIPQIKTKISLNSINDETKGYIKEGYVFSPMFTLGLKKNIKLNEEFQTCLKVEKAD
ncbi:MAG: hypothetical protein JXB50_16630 [Spirochaetes bacterium]|nr:hypothetical protein [Spirochaetota bacterium]